MGPYECVVHCCRYQWVPMNMLPIAAGTNGSLASVLFPVPSSVATSDLTDALHHKSASSVLKSNATKRLRDNSKEAAPTASSEDEKEKHLLKNGVHSTDALCLAGGATDSSRATFPAAPNPFLLPLADSSVSPMAYFPFGNSPLLGPSTAHTSIFNPSPLFSSPIYPYGSTASAKHSVSPDRPVTTRHNDSGEKTGRRKTSHGRDRATSITTTSVSITSPILAVPKPAALTTSKKKQRSRNDSVRQKPSSRLPTSYQYEFLEHSTSGQPKRVVVMFKISRKIHYKY